MQRFFERVVDHPWLTVGMIAGLTLFFLYFNFNIEKKVDFDDWFPAGHPAVLYNDEVMEIFGGDGRRVILVGVVREAEHGIFTPRTLAAVRELTEEIEAIPGVDRDEVHSLANLDEIQGRGDTFEVVEVMSSVPKTQAEADALRERLFESGFYIGDFVSKDGTGTLIFLEIEDKKYRSAVYDRIIKLRKDYSNDETEIYLGGWPVYHHYLSVLLDREQVTTFPLVIPVVMLFLYITLRTIRGIVLPLLVVIASVIWTMGILGVLNLTVYPITQTMPVMLVAIGCADGIHILSKYIDLASSGAYQSRREIVLETMDEMWLPVVLTSVTSTIGFLALTVSEIYSVKLFGVLMGVGIMGAMVFSLTFIPATLVLLRIPTRARRSRLASKGARADGWTRAFNWAGHTVFRHRTTVFATCLLVFVVSVYSIFGLLNVSTDPMTYIDADSFPIRHDRALNDRFSGNGAFNIIIDGKRKGVIKEPSVLEKMDRLAEEAVSSDATGALVGGANSLAKYIRKMNLAMHANNEEYNAIPPSREMVSQYLLIYSLSGDPEDFESFVDYPYQRANVTVRVRTHDSKTLGEMVNYLIPYARDLFSGEDVEVHAAGSVNLSHILTRLIVDGQIQGIIIAIVGVFIVTSFMFRSALIGLVNMLPITLAMFLNFGFMGLMGIPLNTSTAICSSLGIGIGIDYSIHFVSKYLRVLRQDAGRNEAILETMKGAGKAIFFNALVVIAGFSVLFISEFPTTRNIGGIIGLNMLACFVGAITLLPVLLLAIRPERLGGLADKVRPGAGSRAGMQASSGTG